MTISNRSTMVVAALAAAAFALGLVSSLGSNAAEAQAHVVEIRGSEFIPAQISVRAGDTITWINRDIVPHTVTADGESWDSDQIKPGGTWQLVVSKDRFSSYFCQYHPSMKARIRIAQ